MRNLALRCVVALSLLLCFSPNQLDAWTHGAGPAGTVISPLYIGGGGYATGFDMASDGTMLSRIDIFGAYTANTVVGTAWKQMATQSAMPSAYTSPPTPYLNGGAWEVRIDPSNPNNFWMMYCAQSGRTLTTLLKSTNKGATWSTTGFVFHNGDSIDGTRITSGQRIAIDPNNPNVIWASSPAHLYVSQDGGTTFTQVDGGSSGLPAPTGGVIGVVGIQFDPTSGTTAISGGVGTNRMIVGDTGNGFYVSTNAYLGASSTWTLVSAITTPGKAKMASDGNYYANNQAQSNALYRIDTAGTLTTLTPGGGVAWVAVDPNNPARAVTAQFGQVVVGGPINGSPAWSTANTSIAQAAPDAPWLVNTNSVINSEEVYFDPFVTTSSTSITIGTGSRGPFTVAAGLNIVNGDLLRITNTGTPANYMLGTATYSGTSLTITVLAADLGGYLGTKTGGAGTFAAWTITKERLWTSTGFGMFWIDGVKTSGTNTWNSMNLGMDMLVARQVIWPTNGIPLLSTADVAVWPVPSNPVSATVGLTNFGPNNIWPPRYEGQAIDWASSAPTNIMLVTGTSTSSVFEGTNSSSGTSGTFTAFANSPGASTFVAATDANNLVAVSPTAIVFTANGGSTAWAAVTGASIPTSGWSLSLGNNPNYQPICADRGGNAATFYGYNIAGNTWKIVSGTATKQATVTLHSSGSFAYQLRCVPNNGGDLFFTSGNASAAAGLYSSGLAGVTGFTPSAATYPLRFSHDGGVTWTSLTNVANPLSVGFSAPASGQNYPSIVIAGWISGNYGIWRCDTFNPASPASSCAWNNLGTFARGAIDLPTTIEGDPSQWGRFIIGHNGTSFAIGQTAGASSSWPFLLKRDLNHDNDNTPMWLNAAA